MIESITKIARALGWSEVDYDEESEEYILSTFDFVKLSDEETKNLIKKTTEVLNSCRLDMCDYWDYTYHSGRAQIYQVFLIMKERE